MTVSQVTEGGDALSRVRRENETLYAVIKTVSSSLALERVLGGIVDIATDATGCNACFIYFAEGDRLVLRAASSRYAHLVGTLSLRRGEGLTGWVARTKTAEFIRERALEDPRMKYVPELEEERFQSMVAVPILARAGDVIGVVVLHTEAPREFDEDVLNFLVHTASLVGGAIENAQLFEETRRRVDALTTLTQLSHSLAAVTLREDLYDAVTRGARQLLGADACQIWRLDADADELVLVGSDPPDAPEAEPRPGRAALLLDLMRREKGGRTRAAGVAAAELDDDGILVAPLVAGDEQLGILACVVRGRPLRRGRRRPAPRGGKPDGGGPEEGRADRAPHRREHRQGHVRGAGRGIDRDRPGQGGRRPVRSQPPAPVPPRRAGARPARRRPVAGAGRALPDPARAPLSARLLRCPARRGARAGAAAHRSDRTTSSGESWTSSPGRRG